MTKHDEHKFEKGISYCIKRTNNKKFIEYLIKLKLKLKEKK